MNTQPCIPCIGPGLKWGCAGKVIENGAGTKERGREFLIYQKPHNDMDMHDGD